MKTIKKDIWARIDERDAKRIDRLAAQLRLSRSATAGLLIVAGLKSVKGNDLAAAVADRRGLGL